MPERQTADLVALLSSNALFGALEREDLEQLIALARTVKVRRGHVLFNKGDPGDGLYAIIGGRIGIKTFSSSGKEIFLNIMDEGEAFGEIALLDGEPRTAWAIALEDSELMFINRARFLPLLEQSPQLCIRMLSVLCARLRWTSDIIEDSMFRDIRSRLARRLLTLATSYGVDNQREGLRIDLKISQESLGRMLGASRESVNKELAAMQSAGVIAYEHGYITLLEMNTLEDLAQGTI